MTKTIKSDGQIITYDEKGNVISVEYDDSEGGKQWKEFDEKSKPQG